VCMCASVCISVHMSACVRVHVCMCAYVCICVHAYVLSVSMLVHTSNY
jgi:hypothetical protein